MTLWGNRSYSRQHGRRGGRAALFTHGTKGAESALGFEADVAGGLDDVRGDLQQAQLQRGDLGGSELAFPEWTLHMVASARRPCEARDASGRVPDAVLNRSW